MANHTVTLNQSVLIQDTSGATPVTAAQDAKTDQVTSQEEYLSTLVVIPVNTAVPATVVDFGALAEAETVYVEVDRPVTMTVGLGADVYTIRSTFVETYVPADGPTKLTFGNPDLVNVANVRVIVGGNHT